MTETKDGKRIVPLAVYNAWSPLYRKIADQFISEGKWQLEPGGASSASS